MALESRVGKRVDSRERVVSFVPEYAAYLGGRLAKGNDGMVPYEGIKGKKAEYLRDRGW